MPEHVPVRRNAFGIHDAFVQRDRRNRMTPEQIAEGQRRVVEKMKARTASEVEKAAAARQK
jgi:hypothetical protein